jgi:CelD/BcsL family acetyltransferase involved in cellulose biosynthesis
MLDLTLLHAEGLPVAAQYAIDFNGRRHFYINGYDPSDRWQPLSLGSLLDTNRIEAAIEAGLDTADLGRGEGDYKQRYAPRTYAKLHLHVCRTEAAYRRLQVFSALRRLAKRLLGRMEPS